MLARINVSKYWLTVPLLLLLLAACGDAERSAEPAPYEHAVAVVDDAGRTVLLPHPARRIVSLIPSANETLLALGAGDRVVGRTNHDRGPAMATLPSVGGGLDPSLEALVALRPDLVIVWDGKRSEELRPQLERIGIPVFALAADDTADVFRSIGQIGVLTGRNRAADSLAAEIRGKLRSVRNSVAGRPTPSVFYVVWDDPPMTAGPNTFIGQLVELAGGRTIFPDVPVNWPSVSLEEIVRRQPDVILLPQGENPTRSLETLRATPGWRELKAVREGRVARVPADLVNRPGPHIGEAARVLRDAFHPELAGW